MASDLSRDDLRRLARIGAQRRLEDLRREEAAILAAFPDLTRRGGRGTRTDAPAGEAAAPTRRRVRRRKMSAAEKRQVSERMKKYWAAKRKTKA